MLIILGLVMTYVVIMVIAGSDGVFWIIMLPIFVAVFLSWLAIRQWSQPKSVGVGDQGIIVRMALGDVTYEWRDIDSVGIRTMKKHGPPLGLLARFSGVDASLPFVHVGLRRALGLHPFGIALPARVPMVRSLGFYLEHAEGFMAAAHAHLSN